jgi:hypothetical protein
MTSVTKRVGGPGTYFLREWGTTATRTPNFGMQPTAFGRG